MFADPQSVTINAVPVSLPRVSIDTSKAIYQSVDGLVKMTVSHQTLPDRIRHLFRLDKKVVAADPLTATSTYKSLGVYFVIDNPSFGFTSTDVGYITEAMKTWFSTANVTKILGLES